ncbi:hypothetical protein TWF281_004512 [Arthrobotrys megalospora]
MPSEAVVKKAIQDLTQDPPPGMQNLRDPEDIAEIMKIRGLPGAENPYKYPLDNDFLSYEKKLEELALGYDAVNKAFGGIQNLWKSEFGSDGSGTPVSTKPKITAFQSLENLFEELIVAYDKMIDCIKYLSETTDLRPTAWRTRMNENNRDLTALLWIKAVNNPTIPENVDIKAVCAAIYPFLAYRADVIGNLEILDTIVQQDVRPVVTNARSTARDLYGRLAESIDKIVVALESSLEQVRIATLPLLIPNYFDEGQKVVSGSYRSRAVGIWEAPSAATNADVDTITKRIHVQRQNVTQVSALTSIDLSTGGKKLQVSIDFNGTGLTPLDLVYTVSRFPKPTFTAEPAGSFMLLENTSGVLSEYINGNTSAEDSFLPLGGTYDSTISYHRLIFIVKLVQSDLSAADPATNTKTLNIDCLIASEQGKPGVRVMAKDTIVDEYKVQYILFPKNSQVAVFPQSGAREFGFSGEPARGLYIEFPHKFDEKGPKPEVIAGFSKIAITGGDSKRCSIGLAIDQIDYHGFIAYVSCNGGDSKLGLIRIFWLAVQRV